MNVIPTINVRNEKEARDAFMRASHIGATLVQVDISDGDFSHIKSWHDAKKMMRIACKLNLHVEAHCMVRAQLVHARKWIDAGAIRVILHAEVLNKDEFEKIFSYARMHNVSIMIATLNATPIEVMLPFFSHVHEFQVLSVAPGPSGQHFIHHSLEKIREIRTHMPNAYIEVDGGINILNAEDIKNAGANAIAVGAFISEAKNPKEAYMSLLDL